MFKCGDEEVRCSNLGQLWRFFFVEIDTYIKQIARLTFKNLDVDFGEVLFDIRNDDLQIGINLLNKVRS